MVCEFRRANPHKGHHYCHHVFRRNGLRVPAPVTIWRIWHRLGLIGRRKRRLAAHSCMVELHPTKTESGTLQPHPARRDHAGRMTALSPTLPSSPTLPESSISAIMTARNPLLTGTPLRCILPLIPVPCLPL